MPKKVTGTPGGDSCTESLFHGAETNLSAKSLFLPKKGLFEKVSFSAQNKLFLGALVCFLAGASPHTC